MRRTEKWRSDSIRNETRYQLGDVVRVPPKDWKAKGITTDKAIRTVLKDNSHLKKENKVLRRRFNNRANIIPATIAFFSILFAGSILWVVSYKWFRELSLALNDTVSLTGPYNATITTTVDRMQTFVDVYIPIGIILFACAILFLYVVRRRRWDTPYQQGGF